jgi:hypothetical protein
MRKLTKIGFDDKPLILLVVSLGLVLIFGIHFIRDLNKVDHLTIAAGPSRGDGN